MATSAVAQEPLRRAPSRPAKPGAPTAPLKVVTRPTNKRKVAPRRTRLIVVLAASAFAGGLFVIAVSQAMVASQQVRLDNLNSELATAVTTNENLQLTKAQLASPPRILKLAENKLGMISPTNVVYLSPVNPGPSIADSQAGR